MSKHLSLVLTLSLVAVACGDNHDIVNPPPPSPGGVTPGPAKKQPVVPGPTGDLAEPKLNEFVLGHVDADVFQYVEIIGSPNADYSAYTILLVDGDTNPNPGLVTHVIPVGKTDANGIWWSEHISQELEKENETILLVKDFEGKVGDDLDVDGALDEKGRPQLDFTPWKGKPVDSVAVGDLTKEDYEKGKTDLLFYASEVLVKDFDGYTSLLNGVFRVQGASRMGDLWRRNHYFGEGLPFSAEETQKIVDHKTKDGVPDYRKATTLEAVNTPGKPNTLMGTERIASAVPAPEAAPRALAAPAEAAPAPTERAQSESETGRGPEAAPMRPTRAPAPMEQTEQAAPATPGEPLRAPEPTRAPEGEPAAPAPEQPGPAQEEAAGPEQQDNAAPEQQEKSVEQ